MCKNKTKIKTVYNETKNITLIKIKNKTVYKTITITLTKL